MGDILFKLKKFLQNKNTVTIIGVVLIILIIYFGYNYRVKKAINPIANIPYALKDIQPREKIIDAKVGRMSVPPAFLNKNVIRNVNEVVNKISNYKTVIPEGSLFFKSAVVDAQELPDYYLSEIPVGHQPFPLSVTIEKTYGNSIFPENYIDIYLKAINFDGKIIVGKFLENVKILAVKDKNGNNVFETTSETRTPSMIIFAVPEDLYILLTKTVYLSKDKNISAELIPVPSNVSYLGDVSDMRVTSDYLKTFIQYSTGIVEEFEEFDEVEDDIE